MKISAETISEINSGLVDLLASYVHFGNGRQRYAKCPLPDHSEHTGSFSYDKRRNIWKCFGCNAGGDAIKFIKLMHPDKAFVDAVKTAAEILNVMIQYSDDNGKPSVYKLKEALNSPYDVLDPTILKEKVLATKTRQLSDNPLLASIGEIFGDDIVRTTIERYAISFNGPWIEFPQVDMEGKYRTGKSIKYLLNNHRCKDTKPSWAHTGITDNFKQCITGLHLLKYFPGKQVAIVEGSSTMLFMACLSLAAERFSIGALQIFTNYIWVSTGGIGGVNLNNPEFIEVFKNRRITLYPDTGAYDAWVKYYNYLKGKGIEIAISSMMEKAYSSGKIDRNTDLRDYFTLNAESIKKLIVTYPPEWDEPLPLDQWHLQNMAMNLEYHFQQGNLEKCNDLAGQYEEERQLSRVPENAYLLALSTFAPMLKQYILTTQ